jgi:ATP-dependent Clp endopeptidase proteolytic subunit ClpP
MDRAMRTTRRMSNLHTGRPAWFKIKAQADQPTRVDIYDEIGYFAVDAGEFVRALNEVQGDLDIHVNSPGGDIFDGIAIYNSLKQRHGEIAVTVDGLAASAASFIAQAASPGKLAMAPHATMMIHDGHGICIGNADDMAEMISHLNRASDNIAGIYAGRTGKPASYWRDQMRAESWYTDQEAVDAGLADFVLGQEPRLGNAWDLSVFDHPPALQNSWDGPAAMSRASKADNPEAAFRSICAGEKTVGDPGTQAHWALPHHDNAGGPANPDGVSSALGYLPSTHDLKSPSAARAHLEAHQGSAGDSAGDPFESWDPEFFKTALRGALT